MSAFRDCEYEIAGAFRPKPITTDLVLVAAGRIGSKRRHNRWLHSVVRGPCRRFATSIAFADYSLDQANNTTPQFSVADFRERPDQFHSVGGGEKIRDIGGRLRLCALTGVARDLRSAFEEVRHRDLEDMTHRLQPAGADAVAEQVWVQPDAGNPLRYTPSVLPRRGL